MTIPRAVSPLALVASSLLMLSIVSVGALAADAAVPQPHWSGLPIWGVEAEAMGYRFRSRSGLASLATRLASQ